MKQKFDVEQFIEDKKLSEDTIVDAMTNCASLIGYYGQQQAHWKSVVDNLKMQLDNRSAEVELEIKASGDKITEATAKAKVALDAEVKKLKSAIIVAKEQEMLYSNAVSAIDTKAKMAISLGAWKRSELEGLGIHIKDRTGATATRLTDEEREDAAATIRAGRRKALLNEE